MVSENIKIEAGFRDTLAQYLPTYMIPSTLIALEEWPLNINAKLDRKQLLSLANENAQSYIAPKTEVEIALAAIWSEVLNIGDVSRDANFFDLGGHSLLATKMVARIRDRFCIELPLSALFKGPSLNQLSKKISDSLAAGILYNNTIKPVPRDQTIPLSFAQQRMWCLHCRSPARKSTWPVRSFGQV